MLFSALSLGALGTGSWEWFRNISWEVVRDVCAWFKKRASYTRKLYAVALLVLVTPAAPRTPPDLPLR